MDDKSEKIFAKEDAEHVFRVDKDAYKRFQIIKAQFSAKKGKAQTWEEFFYQLLSIERKHREFNSWLYTIGMFFITTFILALPVYLGNPIMAIWMMPEFLITGFIVAYIMAYIFTLYPMKGVIPFKDAPPKILEYIDDLSKKAYVNKPIKLMIIDTPEINAMTYSNIKEHRICLTRGIVTAFENGKISGEELMSILGHEIGHIVNLDTLKNSLVLSFVCIFDMIGNTMMFIGKGMVYVSEEEKRDGLFGLFVLLIGWSIYIAGIIQKLIAKLVSVISYKVSRKQEYAADIVGGELTNPEIMTNALQKIVDLGNELVSKQLESLPYSDRWQLEPRNVSWIDKLYDTHPSISDRKNELMKINEYL
jgi:Zn-dependent protease with chaperone function